MNITNIKKAAKKSPVIINTYLIYMVFRHMPISDIIDFEKFKLFWKIAPYTMVPYHRLTQVYELARVFEQKKISGAFVECGVWRGGCIGIMAYVADKAKTNRKIWLFDSFEGLPEPAAQDGSRAADYASGKAAGELSSIDQCVAPLEVVEYLFFSKLKLNRANIFIEKGWFQDTLPKCRGKVGDIAILRLDGDWYESTKCCLDNLYQNVIKGGYIVIDDYDLWEGARKAVDEFLKVHSINIELKKVGFGGRYFQKA